MSGHADRNGLIAWIQGFKKKPELVFVNHGNDESCESFKELLINMGYNATAPYSGTEYSLNTGKITAYTEGKPIDHSQHFKANIRSSMIYGNMVSQAERLLNLVKSRQGRSNKDNARLTSQIKSIIEKWKE